MKLDLYSKTQNYLDYRLIAEYQANPYVEKLNALFKGEEFALVIINWKQTESLHAPLLNGRYIFVFHYDKTLKKPADARYKLTNKDTISYDYKTSEALIAKNWVDGQVLIELTESYEANGGENVASMFGNYWFPTYIRFGITALENRSDTHAIRFVVMASKEAYHNIKNQGEVAELMKGLHSDFVRGTKGY